MSEQPITSEIKEQLSIEDTIKMLQNYHQQAETSITQIDNSINTANNQINEWKKMQLMILGQKQLIVDLLSKINITKPADTNITK
jgi:esterase/lipase